MTVPELLYTRLARDSTNIRFITFLPTLSEKGEIQCRLETVYPNNTIESPLCNSPSSLQHRFKWGDFAALSYVWGDDKDQQTIVVNGVRVKVHKNLEIALRALQGEHIFEGKYKIWIDAISINQNDTTERSEQVGRMRDIYSRSSQVIAWLGEEADGSSKAFILLHHLAEWTGSSLSKGKATKKWGFGDSGDGYWLALQKLVLRPYWRRLWIMQELVMGGTRVVVRCGPSQLEWSIFLKGIVALQSHWWHYKDDAIKKDRAQIGEPQSAWNVTALHLLHNQLRPLCEQEIAYSADRPDLGSLMVLAATTFGFDPRDKVYGLIGMMEQSIADRIRPDYTMPIPETFTKVAIANYEARGDLELLRDCNLWGKCPSWVPDWTWHQRPGNARFQRTDDRFRRDFNAHAGIPATFTISENRRRLACQGVIVDRLDGIGASRKNRFIYRPETVVQPDNNQLAYDAEHLSQALAFALCADTQWTPSQDILHRKDILHWPSTFEAGISQFKALEWHQLANDRPYYWQWSRWRSGNKAFRLGGRPLPSYFTDTIPQASLETHCWEARRQYNRASDHRRFATTTNGRIGWVPDTIAQNQHFQVAKGDLVAIIFGCTTPLLLRPHGASYRVVGEAYFLGLMDGEVQAIIGTGTCNVQTFELV
ncbi:hypothetical protein LTR56_011737 [Elasticomyces elasticus]|nr:hypothetical protein LTR56_011737 [Elasticomyces elasticus]KAK3663271.1 hypothetical protein LTR22_005929 [Elasticomyces elasticus]KAK4929072.1 hypothetical protein LTR49_004269 [Elasticomyces elasticus]KAK5766451.1 hypothetical protein LTS12_003368 [Elasticomyces elasticus]